MEAEHLDAQPARLRKPREGPQQARLFTIASSRLDMPDIGFESVKPGVRRVRFRSSPTSTSRKVDEHAPDGHLERGLVWRCSAHSRPRLGTSFSVQPTPDTATRFVSGTMRAVLPAKRLFNGTRNCKRATWGKSPCSYDRAWKPKGSAPKDAIPPAVFLKTKWTSLPTNSLTPSFSKDKEAIKEALKAFKEC